MTVAELINLLQQADPSSKVLFLGEYADADEADEIQEVVIPTSEWTHEEGCYEGRQYEVRYPGPAAQREVGYTDVKHETERVVLVSTGPTNLRYME